MKKQLFVMFLASASVFTACKKDDDPKSPKTKQLVKVTTTDADGTAVSTLSYDGSKRLTSIKSDDKDTVNITYNSKGELTKFVSISDEDKSTIEITYSAAGAPASAVVKYFNGSELESELAYTYKVESGKVTEIAYKAENVEIGKSKITYSGDNVTKIETTIVDEELGDLLGLASTITYTYGTKKSPFGGAVKYLIDPFFTPQLLAKNEIVSVKVGTGNAVTYEYTYDNDGYPLTQKSGTGETAVTIKFEYK